MSRSTFRPRLVLPVAVAVAVGVFLSVASHELDWSSKSTLVVALAMGALLASFGTPLMLMQTNFAADNADTLRRRFATARAIELEMHPVRTNITAVEERSIDLSAGQAFEWRQHVADDAHSQALASLFNEYMAGTRRDRATVSDLLVRLNSQPNIAVQVKEPIELWHREVPSEIAFSELAVALEASRSQKNAVTGVAHDARRDRSVRRPSGKLEVA